MLTQKICSSWLQSPVYAHTYMKLSVCYSDTFKFHISDTDCQVVSLPRLSSKAHPQKQLQSTFSYEKQECILLFSREEDFSHRSCLTKLVSVASCDRIKPEIPLTPFKPLKNLLNMDNRAAPTGSRLQLRQALCLSLEIRTLELFSWKKHTHKPTTTTTTTPNPHTSQKKKSCLLP